MKKLSVQSIHPIESEPQQRIFEKKDIPNINFNTKNLDNLENKLKDMKLNNYKYEFFNEIEKVLNLYNDDELKYNENFVFFVMTEVEKYILKSKSGDSKKQLVIHVCSKYFNNDDQIVELIINLLFYKLSQVKFIKRQSLKIVRFFLKIKRNHQ